MKFISNKGKMKQVKYSSGMLMGIPKGSSSLPDDSALDKLVGVSPDLSYISKDEFFKQKNIITTEEKITIAKKERPPLEPPTKKDKKKKPVEKPASKSGENTEKKTAEPQGE